MARRAQAVAQAVETVLLAGRTAPFVDPVAEEDPLFSRQGGQYRGREFLAGKNAQRQGVRHGDRFPGVVVPAPRFELSRANHLHRLAVRIVEEEGGGGEAAGGEPFAKLLVQRVHVSLEPAVFREGRQRLHFHGDLRGGQRRRDAFAADIAERREQPVVRQGDGGVEITADGAGRTVAHAHFRPRQAQLLGRQVRFLDFHGQGHLLGQLGLAIDLQLPVEADERAGDDVGQALENILVEPGEDRAVDGIERLQDAEAIVLVHQRRADHRAGHQAGFCIRHPQQAGIGQGVVDADEFALMEDGARDALVPRDAKGVDGVVLASGGVDDQLARGAVRQEHGAGLRLHHGAGVLQDVLDQVIQAGEGEEIPRREQQRAIALLHCRVVHVAG